MNALVTLADGQAVTTSLAIAEGTENDHASVIKLIRTHQASLAEFGLLDFKSESTGGRPTEYANLNEPQATLLLTMMRNSVIVLAFKVRLVKAFYELAQRRPQPEFAIPQTMPEALRLAADLAEEKAALEATVAEQAPKVAALDRFANHEGRHNTRNSAKILGVRERQLITWLLACNWYYRDHAGRLCAKADKIAAGHLDTLTVEIRRSDGIQLVPQPVVTQKGLARLAVLLAKSGLLPRKDAA